MRFDFFGASLTSATRWVAAFVLSGLHTTTSQADDELLSFSRAPATEERQPANTRVSQERANNGRLSFQPEASAGTARPLAGRTPSESKATAPRTSIKPDAARDSGLKFEQQVGSVSALAYAGLPARLAERAQKGNPIIGPSEHELRKIFLRAVEAAVTRSPKILRTKGEQQAALSDIDEAKGQRWPQVDVGTQTQAVQFGKGSDREQGTGGINVAVSTMLYDWGRVDHTIESRERLAVASDENLAAEMENLGFEVVTTLVELGKQRIIGDLSQDFANRMKELVEMLAGIVAVDAGRTSELTQAKARLLQAQALRDAAGAKARMPKSPCISWWASVRCPSLIARNGTSG